MGYIGTKPQIATTLADNIVTADKIAAGAVTDPKIAAMAATKLTGTVPDANAPSGSVIQVVSVTKTDFFSTSSTDYVDVPGTSVTITPFSTSSKILVAVTGASSGGASNCFAYGVIDRGTQVAIGDSRGSAQRATFDLAQQQAGNPTVWAKPFAIYFLDSPATTSPLTYKLRVKRTIESIGIGGTWDTGDGNRSNVPTTITLMEIAA